MGCSPIKDVNCTDVFCCDPTPITATYSLLCGIYNVVRLDSSRVAILVKVRSGTRMSSSDPTRVKLNYIPVYTTILRQIDTLPMRLLPNRRDLTFPSELALRMCYLIIW